MGFTHPSPRMVNIPAGLNNAPGPRRRVGSNLAIFAAPDKPASPP